MLDDSSPPLNLASEAWPSAGSLAGRSWTRATPTPGRQQRRDQHCAINLLPGQLAQGQALRNHSGKGFGLDW